MAIGRYQLCMGNEQRYPKKGNKKINIAMDNVQKNLLNDFLDDFFAANSLWLSSSQVELRDSRPSYQLH
jgi:hypothetical protein